ncbi:MAG: stage II sporulation protein M [Methanobrevibacter sp.]|uniref:stage II sporulation protein M n=1 Tax=Methanobrevibacter sp. TaxID=66852 RepID=UPI0025D933AA|nr:stage II sporulation protein M [Methanobrevibacter sp.]MBQ6100454.1 stage II sporulation protein M [Methanobrevibacter sp.]
MKLIEDGFFKRNKKIILITVLIMLGSAVVGAGIGFINGEGKYNQISDNLRTLQSNDGETVETSSLFLFIHNLTADLIIIIGGILFSIISVISVIFNGVMIGTPFGVDLAFAASSILPHAIIEYLAGALALAAAFKITQLEIKIIKNRNLRDTLSENKVFIKDIAVIIIIMIVLLAVAAIIEGHITPRIVTWYYGL